MFLVWMAAAVAQESPQECGTPAESVAELRASGSPMSYDCLTTDDAALDLLLAESELEGAQGENRVTRALTIYRMRRLDQEIGDAEARALNPSDRRLLRDAIHAHRGRAVVNADHLMVIEKMGWYEPDPMFINSRLTDLDRSNIDKIDNPPALPKPEVEAQVEVETEASSRRERRCGCATGAPAAGWMGLLALAALVRRRR
jgi:MYXO-CTERM domain-containing protein